MANKNLIDIAIRLGKELGANTSKYLGTKTNVSFLGSGPKDGMLFQKDINPESFVAIGIEKVLPDVESSLAYATGGKLNDFQLEKLIKNLTTMKETANPSNVVSMGGIDSLRAKSGIGERQVTKIASEGDEAARDIASIDRSTDELNAANTQFLDEAQTGNPFKAGSTEQGVAGILDDIGMTPKGIDASIASDKSGIMASVAKGDLPAKTGAAREFLVNTLKVGDEYPAATLNDVISARDMKFIMEGGGGAEGDPLVLVQKYFGPRIAEMIPTGGSSEEIAIFTRKILDNVEDANGYRPDEAEFDALTATIVEPLADGGRAGYSKGGLAKILEL